MELFFNFYITNTYEKLIQEAGRDKSENYMKLDQQQRLYVIVLDKICSPLRKSELFGKKINEKVGSYLFSRLIQAKTIKLSKLNVLVADHSSIGIKREERLPTFNVLK